MKKSKLFLKTVSIKFYLLIIYFLISIFFFQIPVQAETVWTNEKNLVNLYFFHSNTCSHCAEEEKLLTKLEKKYSNLKIYRYEIHEKKTKQFLKIAKEVYDIQTNGVPITIIGEEVYLGYTENSSKVKFLQTIEYYSKYSYQDRLGEKIGITDLPFYKIEKNSQTLEEFMQVYGNYHLIGNLQTKELDTSLIAIITGVFSGMSPIFLFSMIGILIFLKRRIAGKRDQILLLFTYFCVNFLLNSTSIINNEFYTLAIQIFLLLAFTWGLVKYYRIRKRQYITFNILIVIATIVQFLNGTYYNYYVQVFLNVKKFHLLEGFTYITYYANYFISIFFIQFLIVIILTIFINKLTQKFSKI